MKIRLSTPEATFTVSGTISRPQLLATSRDGTHQMRAEEFEAELRPFPAEDAQRWEVDTLTVRGRRVDDRRRTLDVWTAAASTTPSSSPTACPTGSRPWPSRSSPTSRRPASRFASSPFPTRPSPLPDRRPHPGAPLCGRRGCGPWPPAQEPPPAAPARHRPGPERRDHHVNKGDASCPTCSTPSGQ